MSCPVLGLINVGSLSSFDPLFAQKLTVENESDDSVTKWLHIHCKYYRTRVTVQEVESEQELNAVEAVIVYFDAEKESSWQKAQRWMEAVDREEIALRLLVCSHIPIQSNLDSEICHGQRAYHKAAIEKEFELIELNPNPDDIEEGEEFGAQRIKSALEAHMWSNMELLDPALARSTRHPVLAQLNTAEKKINVTQDHSTPVAKSEPSNLAELKNEKNTCEPDGGQTKLKVDQERKGTEEEEEDILDEESIDSFERAFRAVMTTRDRVAQLDHAERRKVAEKLTLQLWRAVGGSPDEIDGLSEGSSDGDD